jgi:membrane protease YdiL (CAAX protease family)
MFNRYWRMYPWGLQLVLAFLMVFTLMSFGGLLTIVFVPRLSGLGVKDIIEPNGNSSLTAVRAFFAAQLINQIAAFLAPALIFAALTHPRVREYLGLRPPGRPVHWLLAAGVMIGLIPVILYGENWMVQHVHLGQKADLLQQKTDDMFKAYAKLKSPGDLIMMVGVLALLPGIAEELIFRGVFLRLFHRGLSRRLPGKQPAIMPDIQRSMVLPVICSALVFAYWHDTAYGFIFIFMAGCVLALIYQLTGSLLCCMWAHFVFNGSQVIIFILAKHGDAATKVAEAENVSIIYPLAGLLIFAGSFYALVRSQTPLAADWSADFKQGEEGQPGD